MNAIKIILHGHAQRAPSQAIPGLVKLSINTVIGFVFLICFEKAEAAAWSPEASDPHSPPSEFTEQWIKYPDQ